MIPKLDEDAHGAAARHALVARAVRRASRHRRRSGSRGEVLVVTLLGLALVAFPWSRLGPSHEAEAQSPAAGSRPLTHIRLQSGGDSAGKDAFDARASYPGAFSGCREARAAGAAPVYQGDPGYAPWLDGDGDGIGCEPHRR